MFLRLKLTLIKHYINEQNYVESTSPNNVKSTFIVNRIKTLFQRPYAIWEVIKIKVLIVFLLSFC